MSKRIFIIALFFVLFCGFIFTQNFSKDVILNIYGAGIYTDNQIKLQETEKEEEPKADKKVPVAYNTFDGNYLISVLRNDFASSSLLYLRSKNVFIRGALAGEVSYMLTADGRKVPAVTKLGDVVARDEKKKGEEYIIAAQSFKYDYIRFRNYNNIWAEYTPRPSIRAIIVDKNILASLGSTESKGFYYFRDDTGQILIREGDYLFMPLIGEEIYAMSSSDFKKMYKLYKSK